MFDDEDERPVGAVIDDGDFDGEDDAPAGQINDPDGEGDPDLESTGNPDDEDHFSDDALGTDAGAPRRQGEVRPKQKANEVLRELKRRTQDAERQAEEARREARDAREIASRQDRQQSEEFERARVALMNPEEKMEHFRQRDRQDMDRRFAQMEFRSADVADKASFTALASQDKALASVSAEVEKVLQEQRAKGFNPNRETVATFLLGQKMRERAKNAAPKQKTRAAERVARETTKPMNGRGDVSKPAARSGNGKSDIEKRLAGIKI